MEELMKELLKTDPETIMTVVKVYLEKYKPLIYGLGNEFLTIYEDLTNNNKIFDLDAKAAKKRFDAYVNAGFSEDQAMNLLLKHQYDLSESMKRIGKTTKSGGGVSAR